MADINNSLGQNTSGGGVWGSITGNILNQLDLTTYLEENYYPLDLNPNNYLTIHDLPPQVLQDIQSVLTEGNIVTDLDLNFVNTNNLNTLQLYSDGIYLNDNLFNSVTFSASELNMQADTYYSIVQGGVVYVSETIVGSFSKLAPSYLELSYSDTNQTIFFPDKLIYNSIEYFYPSSTTSTIATLEDIINNIPGLQDVINVSNTITDGTDTNTVSASGVSVSDGTDTTNITRTGVEVLGGVNQAILNKDYIYFTDSTDETYFFRDKISVNGVDYPLPTGASSQIATLADITGGVPTLPQVLAGGGRTILKIDDADETYTTVLADRGKIIYIPSSATLFSDLTIDDIYTEGDTILIYSDGGGQTIKTITPASTFLPNYTPDFVIGAGELVSITLLETNGMDYYYTYSRMPYEITSGGVPTLQEVTNEGATTTNTIQIDVEGSEYILFNSLGNIRGAIIDHGFVGGVAYSTQSQDLSSTSIFKTGKIINNGVDYPLPTGASSPLATLADITGGVTDGDKGDITVSGSGIVWTINNSLDVAKLADGSVSNTEFQYINSLNRNAQTQLNEKDVLPVLFEKHANVPTWGSVALNNLEGFAFSITGATARNFANTNAYTRRQRMGLTVATTGNLAQARQIATYFNRNSNLHIILGLGFAENCTNANVRAFAGVSTTTLFTNVEPTSLLNCIGIAKLTTSNNLHLIHNDGSGTATAIDLGASFPSNTIETDFYTLELKTNGSNIDYLVTRVNTGDTVSGTISSDLPSTSTALNLGYYVVQSTGVNTTTGIDYFGTNIIKS